MKLLDENGFLTEADERLQTGQNTRLLARKLLAEYPALPLEKTNLSWRLGAFLYTVLANTGRAPEGYFALREKLPALAQQAGLCTQCLLLLDEGAGHAVYLTQPKAAGAEGSFGRMPILVYFEHTTGTVLYENTRPFLDVND